MNQRKTVTLRPKTPKTDAESQALREQQEESKDARERDRKQNRVQAELNTKERLDLARTPDVLRNLLKDLNRELVDATFESDGPKMESLSDRMAVLEKELKDKLALLETFLELQGNTVEALQKQMSKLVTMRTWFGNVTKDEKTKKYNEEKNEKIDAKMKDLQQQIGFMNELEDKQAAERARLRENVDRKKRRQVAIDRNDPAELTSAEQNGATGWWQRDGMRQALKKKQRDCRETALQSEGPRANPDPVGPKEVELPQLGLDEVEWEEQVNAQLLEFGTVAIYNARLEEEAEAELLARCAAGKNNKKKREQNADAPDSPSGKRLA